MKEYAKNNSPMTEEMIKKECDRFGINYEYEMNQIRGIRGKENPKENIDIESLKQEYKKDLDEYTSGKSNLTREEFNEKYKALGIKINMNFNKTSMKNVASDVLAREVQSSQSKLKQDYMEVENPTQEANKSLDE